MSSKKNAKEKKLARQEAERKARTKKFLTNGIAIGMLFIGLALGLTVRTAFGPQTCGGSDADLQAYLAESQNTGVELWKTAENGRVKAALYQREGLGGCVAIFERQLFGLRWKQSGMDTLKENGLQAESSWLEGGFMRRSKCDVVVCGDNRNGEVASYVMTDAEGVSRDGLESGYILDIYILDGAAASPSDLRQYAPDGSELTE